MRKRTSIWTIFSVFLCANTLLMFVASTSGEEGGMLYSLSCRMFMLLIYGMFLLKIVLNGFRLKKNLELTLLVGMFSSALASFFANPIGSVAEWLIIILSYLEIPVLAIIMRDLSPSDDFMKSRIFTTILLMIALYLIYRAYVTPVYDQYSGALTMGYSNSNRTAIYVLLILCVCMTTAKLESKKSWKYMMLVMSVLLTTIVPFTQSRTTMACVVLVWVFWFCEKKILKWITARTLLLLLLLPLFFTVIYLYLIEQNTSWVVDTVVYGKSLDSGRKYIYRQCFDQLQGKWILGNYAFSPLENKHNILLSVMTSFGLVGLSMFIAFYYTYFKYTLSRVKTVHGNFFALLCMLVVYLSGIAEAAVFSSGIMYAGMFGMLMMLVNVKRETGVLEEA